MTGALKNGTLAYTVAPPSRRGRPCGPVPSAQCQVLGLVPSN